MLYIFYPSHENHELSIWFLGVMTGWFIGASNIKIISNPLKKLLTSIFAIFIVFFLLIVITEIEKGIIAAGLTGFIFSYCLGMTFSILVTWVIPRLLRLVRLAS